MSIVDWVKAYKSVRVARLCLFLHIRLPRQDNDGTLRSDWIMIYIVEKDKLEVVKKGVENEIRTRYM